jgi:hypothetical protein
VPNLCNPYWALLALSRLCSSKAAPVMKCPALLKFIWESALDRDRLLLSIKPSTSYNAPVAGVSLTFLEVQLRFTKWCPPPLRMYPSAPNEMTPLVLLLDWEH